MKVIGKIFLVGCLILGGLFFFKDLFIKTALVKGVEAVTGLRLNMDHFQLRLMASEIEVKDVKLFNPDGFPDPVMVDLPKVYADFRWISLLSRKILIHDLEIHLKELLVLKNQEGQLNLNEVKALQSQKAGKTKTSQDSRPLPLKVERFRLKIGEVVYKDYAKIEPATMVFPIHLDEEFENITDLQALVRLIVYKALFKTTIASLVNFDLKFLKNTVTEMARSAPNLIPQATGQAMESLQSGVQKTQENVQKAIQTLKETTNNLTDLPFFKSTEAPTEIGK